jgi:hypothetical protein
MSAFAKPYFVQFVQFVHFAVRVEEETPDLESAQAAKASLPTVPILKLCCCAAVRKPNVQLKKAHMTQLQAAHFRWA